MNEIIITGFTAYDIRFPTSETLDGSDAMNEAPDYSAAYIVLHTNSIDLEGHGLTFTIGRGNEVCVAAIRALAPKLIGKTLKFITEDLGAFWRFLIGDSQLRWLGPEKGVIHLATSAVVNAIWDLYAKSENKPLWKLLTDMSPEELTRTIDFSYIDDVITQEEALNILEKFVETRNEREKKIKEIGFPAYTTAAGWLGYTDDKMRRLCKEALSNGWDEFKVKVGRNLEDDIRRLKLIREEIGPKRRLTIDANQVWSVSEAIKNIHRFKEFNIHWIEEPTHPDDILGHLEISKAVSPIGVATGEHCHNSIMFKQFLEVGAMQFCQLDTFRLGGVNEVLAVLLLAAKHNVPVCPHGGGVGLCESGLHISVFDYICVSGSFEGRVLEYVEHLHEHFIDPVLVKSGRYSVPSKPGYSSTMKPKSLREFEFHT